MFISSPIISGLHTTSDKNITKSLENTRLIQRQMAETPGVKYLVTT